MSLADQIAGFKVRFAERSHSPTFKPHFEHLHGSVITNTNEISEDTSIILGDRGKKRFPPMASQTKDYKPHKKPIGPPHRINSPPRGKRCIQVKHNSEEIEMQSKRHLLPAVRKSDYDVAWSKKGKVLGPDGKPVSMREPENYNLETTMNRKQRLIGELDRRNGIGTSNPGDLPFKTSEHAPDFFKEGGIIPGSTIQMRQSTKPVPKKNENDAAQTSNKKLEATYGKMKARLERDYDIAQVNSLTVSFLQFICFTVFLTFCCVHV